MGAGYDAPRAACRPAGRRNHGITYTGERSTSRTDTERLDWLEMALRDGLEIDSHWGDIVMIGIVGVPGIEDLIDGRGRTLREAIDDGLDRDDAAFAALDAQAEVAP